jgi:hypothetical protein
MDTTTCKLLALVEEKRDAAGRELRDRLAAYGEDADAVKVQAEVTEKYQRLASYLEERLAR